MRERHTKTWRRDWGKQVSYLAIAEISSLPPWLQEEVGFFFVFSFLLLLHLVTHLTQQISFAM